MGPAAGGRNCANHVETLQLERSHPEPVLRQPVQGRKPFEPHLVGAVRLPLAGPYRPWARLYVRPDGTLDWQVRLWEVDRAVVCHLDTEAVREFARVNGLRRLADQVEALVTRALRRRRA